MQKWLSRGWSPQEDSQLQKLVASCPHARIHWVCLAKELSAACGRQRSGKQCRERWQHQVNPEIRKETWSEAQREKLFELHRIYGNKWSTIAQHLPGRTDNIIKNYFYAFVRKNITKINSALRGRPLQKQWSQIRQFDCDFTSKLMLVNDGNFQHKIRLNSLDLQSTAREILSGIISLAACSTLDLNNTSQFGSLVRNMHNFRLNSKKKKQSKKIKEKQRFLREENYNQFTSSLHTGQPHSFELLQSQGECGSGRETFRVEKNSNSKLQQLTTLQEEALQGFFWKGNEMQVNELPYAACNSSQYHLLPDSIPQSVPVGNVNQQIEEKMELGKQMVSHRSQTRLLDSLRDHLANITCIFTPEYEEEWEFAEESLFHPPPHTFPNTEWDCLSLRSFLGSRELLYQGEFTEIMGDDHPL